VSRGTRNYNISELYKDETRLRRYVRLTVGEGASAWALFWHEIVLGLLGWLPGIVGLTSRSGIYSVLFKGFSRKSYLGHHVTLRCPRHIELSAGVIIDDYVQLIATSQRYPAISIGKNSFVRSLAMINAGPPEGFVRIGKRSGIGQGTLLYGNGGLTIGDNVMIAGHSSIVASSHNYDDPSIPIVDQGYSAKGIVIGDNVWIGAGARILDGVTIGEGAVIGANAVVTRSVAPGQRVGGVPARVLKTRQSTK